MKFHECFDSDHRGIFCDLSKEILNIKEVLPNLDRVRIVGSNSTNKEGEKYIRYIYTQ
jgi:hypothetical protein